MSPARKRDLSPLDHQVCDEVAKLRKDMRLSASVFCRQMGITIRTLGRWEKHLYAPRTHHLKRIKQLRDMQDQRETRDYHGTPIAIDLSHLPSIPVTSPIKLSWLYKYFSIVLLEMRGGQVSIPRDEIKSLRTRHPRITFNPQTRCYTLVVRPKVKRTPVHAA